VPARDRLQSGLAIGEDIDADVLVQVEVQDLWLGPVTLILRDGCDGGKKAVVINEDGCELEGKEVDGKGKERPARKEKERKKKKK
jgi:hypothetical protein